MQTSRRGFLALATGLWQQAVEAAQSHSHAVGQSPPRSSYSFGFFTEVEGQMVRELAARIVPASERSGGASAARVEEYIDFVLGHAPEELRRRWREALARLEPRIRDKTPQELDSLLVGLAQNEFAPATADEEFFVLLKAAVIYGFYTSEEGIRKELGYLGNTFLREFPGCTHESHQPPPGHRPLLRQRLD